MILGDITNNGYFQLNLFDDIDNRAERFKLMKTIDHLNQSYGLKTVHLAVEGSEAQAWHVKSEFKSGNYLSDIDEILTINI